MRLQGSTVRSPKPARQTPCQWGLTSALAGKTPVALARWLMVLMLAAPAPAEAEPYLTPEMLDLASTLPAPPSVGSPAEHEDIEAVVEAQQHSSAARRAMAIADNEVSPERFANGLLGSGFKRSRAPQTFLLLRKVTVEGGRLTEIAKEHWARPRPFLLDRRIQPLVGRPANPAYPSGHTAFAFEMANILGAILPERRGELLGRAAEYGQSRVIVGVHYPSDVASGREAGTHIAAVLLKNERFAHDIAAASLELKAALAGSNAR